MTDKWVYYPTKEIAAKRSATDTRGKDLYYHGDERTADKGVIVDLYLKQDKLTIVHWHSAWTSCIGAKHWVPTQSVQQFIIVVAR